MDLGNQIIFNQMFENKIKRLVSEALKDEQAYGKTRELVIKLMDDQIVDVEVRYREYGSPILVAKKISLL